MIPPVGVAVISAAVLAYEVLLVRLFAIVQWHHFAFMAISVALLGFGISGALIVLFRSAASRLPTQLFVWAALAFAVTAPGAFLLAQQLPFNALEVIWAPAQLLYLGLIYLLLAVPFTAGASCIGIAFQEPEAIPGRVYFWNLLGSGFGALGIIGALFVLSPVGCLVLVAALAIAAAIVVGWQHGARARSLTGFACVLAVSAWWAAPNDWTALRISEFKGLTRALAVQEARLLTEHSNPLSLLSVVESPVVPFRYAPGLSLTAPALPPAQLGIYEDGAFSTVVDLWRGEPGALEYLAYSTDALGYALAVPEAVLVLDSGGGHAVLQAIAHGARLVDATEENPAMLHLVRDELAARTGRLFSRPEVTVHLSETRHFVTAIERSWDLIKLPPLAGAGPASAQGLNEDFLLTREGLAAVYRRLSPEGWLSATAAIDLPPRIGLKLVATLDAALRAAGVAAPAEHLIAIRGLTTMTVLAKRGPVVERDIQALRIFTQERGFDLVHYPRMASTEANHRTKLAEPVFFDGVHALLGPDRGSFISHYKFDIAPTSDDRPYFHDVFSWSALPEILVLGRAGGAALLELGELILVATLIQAFLLGAFLVLLPLRLRLAGRLSPALTWRFGIYFTALGVAFLFIEIAWIQRFVLLLGNPLYAVAVVLTGFLVFAALGAGSSKRLEVWLTGSRLSALDIAVPALIALTLAYLVGLPHMFDRLSGLDGGYRVPIALALIAPLSFFMGMPFPVGLAHVNKIDADFVPWAWGLNGCASVVSSVAAILILMNAGITATVLSGIGLYVVAWFVFRSIGAPVPPP